MQSDPTGAGYKIWAVDNIVYGPVELPTLISWVKDERVTSDTWVFNEAAETWQRAAQVPELQMFFRDGAPATNAAPSGESSDPTQPGVKPGSLRRIKVFGAFSDKQLISFVQFMEVLPVRQWLEVVRQGQPGDAMYFVLEGELRVRMLINGKETILATLGPGEFFGEIALFDHGPRSADVVANQNSVLLKVSAASFERLIREAPDLAAPFLLGMGKTLTARIRADNKRYRESVTFSRGAPPSPFHERG